MKLDLEQILKNPRGEPFEDRPINVVNLWATLRAYEKQGKTLGETLDDIEELNGGKGRALVESMTLGMALWRAVAESPKHAETTKEIVKLKMELGRLSYKLLKQGSIDLDEKEVSTIMAECERFNGVLLYAIEREVSKARTAEASEHEAPKDRDKGGAEKGAGLVAVDGKEATG
jgi:hypothetical protein